MLSDWTSADYFSNIASLILFIVAYWLGRRQGLIIERVGNLTEKEADIIGQISKLTGEVHRLQTAVAALQVREKVGVMKQRAEEVNHRPSAAITLLTDSISVLDVYPFAPEDLRQIYIETLDTAFTALCKRSSSNGKLMQLELAAELVRQAKRLFDQGESELAFSLMRPVVSCAISLNTTQTPIAGSFGILVKATNRNMQEMLEQYLSMDETEIIRRLEAELFPSPSIEAKTECQGAEK